ncbi:hypothetical protein [Mitsuaria sp. 7]|uniref:hypothetical protein n=1 Tax=Mitsuaria sp. 7 TaxID=1658665 RepID=UPI0007DCF3C4|nr:hypothetical protein [Mitsuaria sp. 7]ANH69638.1 hypothetical protein ABE85_22365 [Mitsuaria sp. 7]
MPAEQVFGGHSYIGWLTFILEMTRALAWPVLVGGVIVHFRRHLRLLFAVVARSLRRVNRWKFGEVELAASVLAPALSAAESKAEAARSKLEGEDVLDAEQRKHLVAQLETATRELTELKAAHEEVTHYMMVPLDQSAYGKDRIGDTFLRRLLAHVDRVSLLTQTDDEAQGQVKAALTEDLRLSLKEPDRTILIAKAILRRDNLLTPRALKRLRELARTSFPGFNA